MQHVSGITFIRYAQNRKIGKTNIFKASPEGDKLVVFYYLNTSKILPD
jgi:hypothetical protein